MPTPRVDLVKVDAKVNELNSQGDEWVPLDGIHILTAYDPESNSIVLQRGYTLKGFLNKKTGEVKYFDADLFLEVT